MIQDGISLWFHGMYEEFFGIQARPFELSADPRFIVGTDAHREALTNLEYGISSRKGVTLLLGPAGTGKTTMIRATIGQLPATCHVVYLNYPPLSRVDFQELLAARFTLSAEARLSRTRLLAELDSVLRDRAATGELTALIIDEAQVLTDDLFEDIRLLTNLETDTSKLISIVLAGQPALAERLNEPALNQLKQRVALRCELRPLTIAECAGYIAGRVLAAGGNPAHLFTREAIHAIHERAGGVARVINVLADNALLSAFAHNQAPVTAQIVDEVGEDFDLARPTGALAEPTRIDRDVPPANRETPSGFVPMPPPHHVLYQTAMGDARSTVGDDEAPSGPRLKGLMRTLRERLPSLKR